MSMLNELSVFLRAPDPRPARQIEEEILDELDFHLQMRTEDNISAGMSPSDAQADALRRFGDFERIRRACRRTLLGERIMLQRIQALLTVILLAAVVYMGVQFYLWQKNQNASMTRMMQTLEDIAQSSKSGEQAALLAAIAEVKPPVVISTVPEAGASDVDPNLTEIRVTYSKEMMDGSWSWAQTSEETFPETTGDVRYLEDHKTCVMPVKLQPGKKYEILLNSENFQNFRGRDGKPAVPYLLNFKTRE
jgi:hypothetical protein